MTSLFKEIEQLGYTPHNTVMGLYAFKKQVGDNVVGYIENLEVNTQTGNYMFYKIYGKNRIALPLTFELHLAITKFLYRIGQMRYE